MKKIVFSLLFSCVVFFANAQVLRLDNYTLSNEYNDFKLTVVIKTDVHSGNKAGYCDFVVAMMRAESYGVIQRAELDGVIETLNLAKDVIKETPDGYAPSLFYQLSDNGTIGVSYIIDGYNESQTGWYVSAAEVLPDVTRSYQCKEEDIDRLIGLFERARSLIDEKVK